MNIKTALRQLTTWFEEYAKGFSSDDPFVQENIDLKKHHTLRVRGLILDIGQSINLDEDNICVAEACAILHDIGRFEQYRKYGTFSDAKSVNHAALGVRIIRELEVLKNFPSAVREIIIRSVGCHNMSRISGKKNKDWLLFLKLVRDADKIDILFVVTEYYKNSASGSNKVLELHLPDIDIISDAVYQPLVNENIAFVKDLRSLNDFKLYQMGWIYDLYFRRSLQIIKTRRYLEIIRNSLSGSSKKADEVYQKAKAFLDKKLKNPENILQISHY